MLSESFHKCLKHIFGKGMKIYQLQDGLAVLESYLKEREQDLKIREIKGFLSYKTQKLRKAHDRAEKFLRENALIGYKIFT